MSINRPLSTVHLFTVIFALFVGNGFAVGLGTETLYLTWEHTPETTMTVQWITDFEDRPSAVYVRPYQEVAPWNKVEGVAFKFPSANYLIHRVELKHLKPDSTYTFMTDDSEKEFRFCTLPTTLSSKGISFVVGGDMYHDDIETMELVSRQAALKSPAFAVIGGDIAYAVSGDRPERIDHWIDWIKSWHRIMVSPEGNLVPVIAAIGNHDIIGQFGQTPKEAAVFTALFPLAGQQIYTVFDVGSYLSIFLLDSGHANPIIGRQTAWLKEALAYRKDQLYRFVVYHVPAYPSVRRYYTETSNAIRLHWVPLFEQAGVQTVFEHHDHAYKRTVPLLKNKFNPQGVVYVGDGGWGVAKLRKPHLRGFRHYLAKFASVRNFILVKLTAQKELIEAINDKGEVIDTYLKMIHPEEVKL